MERDIQCLRNGESERTPTLGNWVGADRKKLIQQLRGNIGELSDPEQSLFDVLVENLEKEEFQKVQGITAAEAAEIAEVQWISSADQNLYPLVSKLRDRLNKASQKSLLKPRAYITRPPYRIEVLRNPPSSNKKYPEPCIGLILADATDWFVGDVIKGMNEVCNGKYDLIVEVANYSQESEAKSIARLAERVRGLLIVPVGDHVLDSAITSLQSLPCVLIDRYFPTMRELPSVHPDDKVAGAFAARYLKDRGCKRIIVVPQGSRTGSNFVITPLRDRADGCQGAGVGIEIKFLSPAGSDEQGGFDALEDFEKGNKLRSTDGIFALTDRVAVGCRSYLATHHPDLPIRLISTEGQPFGDFLQPQLTSIKFDNFKTGRLAARALLALIAGRRLPFAASPPRYRIAPRLLQESPPKTGKSEREIIPIE